MPKVSIQEVSEGIQEMQLERAERLRKEALLKARVENAKKKKNERKQLAEKRKVEYAIALAIKYRNFVKAPYAKRLRKKVMRLLDFIPPEMIKKLMKKTSARDRSELVSELIGRVIFLPHGELQKFMQVLGESTKRNTPAIHYRAHAFLNVKYANRRDANKAILHEVVHMVSGMTQKYFGEHNEVLPMALELFVEAEQKKSERERISKIARRTYLGRKDSKVYVRGINRGRKVFLMADQLVKQNGRKAALFFFHDLFRSDVLSDYALDSAAKAAREKHPA